MELFRPFKSLLGIYNWVKFFVMFYLWIWGPAFMVIVLKLTGVGVLIWVHQFWPGLSLSVRFFTRGFGGDTIENPGKTKN
jgi:hypothetical protein